MEYGIYHLSMTEKKESRKMDKFNTPDNHEVSITSPLGNNANAIRL